MEESNNEIETKTNYNMEKHEVLLKLINALMKNMNKGEIKRLEEFVEIDREDLVNTKNHETLMGMQEEIFKKGRYKRSYVGWKRHKNTNYIMTFLRYGCDQLGYKFTYYKKGKGEVINNKSYRRTHYIYSIKK